MPDDAIGPEAMEREALALTDGLHTPRWPTSVHIMDVGPRDGLQNEPYPVSAEQKLRLIAGLVAAGVRNIEVTSFVSPKAVPQMADAAEVAAGLRTIARGRADLGFYALIPNEKGYERALAAGIRHIGLVMSVTETMNRKNINLSVAESVEIARRLIERARADGVTSRVYVSVAFVCPFEGRVDPEWVYALTDEFLAMGADQCCLTDAIGRANPQHVAQVFGTLAERHGPERLAAHFHNTYDMALANTVAALQQGIRFFDASIGGLGGCPFAPGATGNVATEDLVNLMHQMGIETGIDLEKLADLAETVRELSGSLPPSAYYRATRVKRKAS